jgi:type II secretion system protein H
MTSTTGPRGAERRHRAFTLIELVLVMTLIVVVMALVAPSLGNFFRGRNLDSESRRFLALCRYARSRAVSEGVPMLLWLDPDRRLYGLTEEYGFGQPDQKPVAYELEPDVELQFDQRGFTAGLLAPTLPRTLNAGANAAAIRFQPDGFISESSPQSLWFREKDKDGDRREDGNRRQIWITQTVNRVSYEVQTNNVAFVRR